MKSSSLHNFVDAAAVLGGLLPSAAEDLKNQFVISPAESKIPQFPREEQDDNSGR